MKGRRIMVLIAISILGFLNLHSIVREKNYLGRPVADALTDIIRRNPEINISFIYDVLESYVVKGKIISDDPLAAIRELVDMNPISVREREGIIFVEALQKGNFHYTGHILDTTGSPVEFATVILLNPKDSTAITYGMSDSSGFFSIPCDRKKVIAKFSSTGYKTRFIKTDSFAMGNVALEILPINLQRITVSNDTRYVEADKTIYIPTAREKNAAQGGMQLLQFMSIPSLKVSIVNGSLSTLSGQPVAVFIDYLPATSEELSNMKPADVKKVEILDYPVDPRLGGVPHAVNFIMQRYEYGGYTKLLAQQTTDLGYGYYSLSSKFSYGKMIYNLYTGYDHFKSDKEGTSSITNYDFGNRLVEQTQTTPESQIENNEAYISAQAQYVTEKTSLSNQLSLRKNDVPHSLFLQDNAYSPGIYPDAQSINTNKKQSINSSWAGNYRFSFPRSIMLVVTPSAKYGDNSSNTFFSENGTDIINDVSEKAWSANLNAAMTKGWERFSLTTGISGELSDNKIHYTGDNPADVNYSFRSVGARVSGNLKFGRIWLQPSAKFFFSQTLFDGQTFNQPLPSYYIAAGVDLGRKHSLSVSSEMSQWTIGVANRSPNIVVKNLLNAVKGNPDLKTWLYNSFMGQYTWIPIQKLSLSTFLSYQRHTRPIDYSFSPAEINGREMMLRTIVKDGYFQELSCGMSAVSKLFDNSLVIQGDLEFSSFRRGGTRRYHRNVVNGSVSAIGYLKNFYLTASYQFHEKKASSYENVIDQPSFSVFRVGWNRKGWNISADIRNPFRSDRLKMWEFASYANYSKRSEYFGDAYRRRVWITAVYTISYGKKLKESNISRGSAVSSGIVD